MTITVTRDRDIWDRTIKAFDRLAASSAAKNLIVRAGIKASNIVGKQAREGVSEILAVIAGTTTRSAIKPRSRAASRFQAEPRYTLDFPRAIPIGKLKSTKVDRKAGTVEFRQLSGAISRFSARRGRGGRFALRARGPLPARLLGGLVFTRKHPNPRVSRYAAGLAKPLAEAFEGELDSLLTAVNRR